MAATQQSPGNRQPASAERRFTLTRDFDVPRSPAFEGWTLHRLFAYLEARK